MKKQHTEYNSQGNPHIALKKLFLLKKQAPNNPEIPNDIGTLLYSIDKKEESLDFFLSALKIDPNHQDARKNLQKIAQDQSISSNLRKRIDKACVLKNNSHQKVANEKTVLSMAIDLQEKGNIHKAWSLINSIIRTNPENRDALHVGAKILHELGDNQNAYILAKNSVSERPHPPYFHTLADISMSLKKAEEAIYHRKRALLLEKIQAAAEQAVLTANRLKNGQLSLQEIEHIAHDAEKSLDKPGWNNISFYLHSHVLMYKRLVNTNTNIKPLESALESKGWSNKKGLYQYWFDRLDFQREVQNSKISIVIISYRLHENTMLCLKELRKQLKNSGEIIFVNNGCEDNEFASLLPYIDIYIKLKRNAGVCISRNIGAAISKSPILMFIEDDGIPDSGLINAHLSVYDKYDAVAVRGVYLCRKSATPSHYYLGPKLQPSMINKEGNSSFLSKPFFEINGWSDYLFYGSEGREISFRLIKKGYDCSKQLYTPDAILYHEHLRNHAHMEEKWLKLRASWILMYAMYPDEYADYLHKWSQIKQGIIEVEPMIKKQ
ncbi:MAG: glycosyltransferase [Bacteroidota bacterium]